MGNRHAAAMCLGLFCATLAAGCADTEERIKGSKRDRTGVLVARAKTFDQVRERSQTRLEPDGTSEVVRGEGRGVVVDVYDPDGETSAQVIAYYLDPSDNWKAYEYLSGPVD